MSGPAGRRMLGMALLAGAVIFVTMALLFYMQAIPVPEESRLVLVAVLAIAAAADAVIGLRLVSES